MKINKFTPSIDSLKAGAEKIQSALLDLIKGNRQLAQKLIIPIALSITACNNEPSPVIDDETMDDDDGSMSESETMGMDVGDGLACDELTLDDVVQSELLTDFVVAKTGETASIEVRDGTYEGFRFELKKVVEQDTAIFLNPATGINIDKIPGTKIDEASGININLVDANQPYINNADDTDCDFNILDLNVEKEEERAELFLPDRYGSVIFCEADDDGEPDCEMPGESFSSTRTELGMEAKISHTSPYYFRDESPAVDQMSVELNEDNVPCVDTSNVTDEGQVLSNEEATVLINGQETTLEDDMHCGTEALEPGIHELEVSVGGANFTRLGHMPDQSTVMQMVEVENTNVDPCEDVDCGSGACVSEGETATCQCDEGFTGDNCEQCDTENGLYEDDFPTCSPDVTPPSAPVIETNFGDPFAIFEENFELEGSCDSDTETMEYRIDDSEWMTIESYSGGETSWSLNGTLEIGSHTIYTRAKDLAENTSQEDSIAIFRST